jgi:hypothetical protein
MIRGGLGAKALFLFSFFMLARELQDTIYIPINVIVIISHRLRKVNIDMNTNNNTAFTCSCGLSHRSDIAAVCCERCLLFLGQKYLFRKVTCGGKVVWETSLSEKLREGYVYKKALQYTPLTYNISM